MIVAIKISALNPVLILINAPKTQTTSVTFSNSKGQIEFCPAGCTSDNLCMNCKDGEMIFKEEDEICFFRSCQNNLFQENYTKCIDDNNKGVSCIKGEHNEFSCGECKNGSQKCEQSVSSCKCHTCKNEKWVSLCENNYSCKGSANNYTGCGECTNGKMIYYQDGKACYHKQCANGIWQTPIKCDGGNSCKGSADNYKCGECVNGNYYSESSDVCVYKKCSAGMWESKDSKYTCPNSYSCNKNRTACGVCRNKQTKCLNSRLYTCTDGAWPAKGTYCPKGCHSSGEKCKP